MRGSNLFHSPFGAARNEGSKHREEAGVLPVQRHWDSSKSEVGREPERKEVELETEE